MRSCFVKHFNKTISASTGRAACETGESEAQKKTLY
jgi:hypothetical protein